MIDELIVLYIYTKQAIPNHYFQPLVDDFADLRNDLPNDFKFLQVIQSNSLLVRFLGRFSSYWFINERQRGSTTDWLMLVDCVLFIPHFCSLLDFGTTLLFTPIAEIIPSPLTCSTSKHLALVSFSTIVLLKWGCHGNSTIDRTSTGRLLLLLLLLLLYIQLILWGSQNNSWLPMAETCASQRQVCLPHKNCKVSQPVSFACMWKKAFSACVMYVPNWCLK